MPTKKIDADVRITTFGDDFFEMLESVGCDDFREYNPKKSVLLLCSRLKPTALKREIRKRLEYEEPLKNQSKTLSSW